MNAPEHRLPQAFGFALAVHLAALALLGLVGTWHLPVASETIYDVALIGGGSSASNSAASAPAQQPDAPPPAPVEPTPPPQPEDIIEKVQPVAPLPAAPTAPAAANNAAPTGGGDNGGSDNGQGNGEGSGSGDGAGDGDAIQAPTVAPRLVKSVAPPYPSGARSRGIEGTVRLAILLDKEGVPEEVEIDESSGNKSLDNAAQTTAYKWRFSPGLNDRGRPVRCYVHLPIAFRLE